LQECDSIGLGPDKIRDDLQGTNQLSFQLVVQLPYCCVSGKQIIHVVTNSKRTRTQSALFYKTAGSFQQSHFFIEVYVPSSISFSSWDCTAAVIEKWDGLASIVILSMYIDEASKRK
jgi:hypothetical protein